MKIVRCHYCDGTGMVIDAEANPRRVEVTFAASSLAEREAERRAETAPMPPAEPSMAELPPPMPLEPYQAPSVAENRPAGTCSQGHPWKTVPAGTSKRTGKDYAAFVVCDDSHAERPRR